MRGISLALMIMVLGLGILFAQAPDMSALIATLKLAQSGDAEAQWQMAGYYEQGLGVEPDQQEAIRWYRQAATSGHVEAQYKVGAFFSSSTEEAVQWYEKAALQGHLEAQIKLGNYYNTTN